MQFKKLEFTNDAIRAQKLSARLDSADHDADNPLGLCPFCPLFYLL